MNVTTQADGTTITTFDIDDVVVIKPQNLQTPHSYPDPIPGYAVGKGKNTHWISTAHLTFTLEQQFKAWDKTPTP